MTVHSSPSQSTQLPLAATTPRGKGGVRPEHAPGFARHLEGDHQPPAQAARAALADRPDLAGKPFGQIVSLFARGLDLPAAEVAGPEAPETPPTAEEPPANTGEETASDGTGGEQSAPTTEI